MNVRTGVLVSVLGLDPGIEWRHSVPAGCIPSDSRAAAVAAVKPGSRGPHYVLRLKDRLGCGLWVICT